MVNNRFLMTELYELTMSNGFFMSGKANEIAHFDLFFRKVPDKGGFAIFAGLSRMIELIKKIEANGEAATHAAVKKDLSNCVNYSIALKSVLFSISQLYYSSEIYQA